VIAVDSTGFLLPALAGPWLRECEYAGILSRDQSFISKRPEPARISCPSVESKLSNFLQRGAGFQPRC
jgi:hypothetical protein